MPHVCNTNFYARKCLFFFKRRLLLFSIKYEADHVDFFIYSPYRSCAAVPKIQTTAPCPPSYTSSAPQSSFCSVCLDASLCSFSLTVL